MRHHSMQNWFSGDFWARNLPRSRSSQTLPYSARCDILNLIQNEKHSLDTILKASQWFSGHFWPEGRNGDVHSNIVFLSLCSVHKSVPLFSLSLRGASFKNYLFRSSIHFWSLVYVFDSLKELICIFCLQTLVFRPFWDQIQTFAPWC